MPVERAAGGTSLIDVLDRVLDKGIVIDAWVRVSLVGIDLITVEARVVVASIDTYLKYSEAVGAATTASRPAWRPSRMRKSLPKTPHSEPSSRVAPLPAGAARGRRRTPARSQTRAVRRTATPADGDRRRRLARRRCSSTARLRLLEGFLSRTEIADCAQYALQWLGEVARRRAVALPDQAAGEPTLFTVGVARLRRRDDARRSSSRSTTGATRSITRAQHRRQAYYPAVAFRRRSAPPAVDAVRGRRRSTSCRSASASFSDEPFGLLLFGRRRRSSPPSCGGSRAVFGQKLDQILRQQALTEGDRRQGRERSLLYSIINAVTDPILLTDTEGRLLIANARALTLFTASEEESEGRRGAVRMNNMLLSSALSSKAIEETGAARRELLLVNPVDGSDLLFELLSTVTEDPRHGTGVVSILRNVSDLRRASEEIEENYRRLRVAEAQARAESDRLNLIIDSVADPIVVTDAGGATSLMNEPAERLFTIPSRRQRRRAALGAGQRRALLVVHRRHAGQRRSAARRRDRPGRSARPARRCRSRRSPARSCPSTAS